MTTSAAPSRPHAPPPDPRRTPARGSGWFRAAWRWHFFASFLVVPVLLLLATTGLIYLLRFQLEPLLHPGLYDVDTRASGGIAQPYVSQLAVVEEAVPGSTAVSLAEPRDTGDPTIVSVTTADGAGRDVFVDPYRLRVLGSVDPDTTLSGRAIRLHGELMSGTWGDRVIEVGVCWALVMALTGYYLFVRGFQARRRAKRAERRTARLRYRHGMVGAFVGVGLLTLLVTGLPWTGFWGEKVQSIATDHGSSLWSLDPGAQSDPSSTLDESLPHSHAQDVPWGQGDSPVPDGATEDDGRSVANVDTAIAVADREGLRHPMTVALPADDDATGVFSVIGYAFDAPSDERTVHVGRYGGEVESTYGFDDYPLLAKVVAQGIGLHEGRSLGLWSFWGSAAMCLSVVFMCVTGPLMWWRRRPRGAAVMGAPRGRMPVRATPLLAVVLVALGVLLPLFGLTLVVALLLDQVALRRVPVLARWFGVT
jgi:uncharacterized iron-regulated membrane protein